MTYRSIVGHVRERPPRVGKIRLGVKTDEGYPRDCPHFVLDADLPGRKDIVDLYGEKPSSLLVTFHSDDIEEVFPQRLEAWTQTAGLYCCGNGEEAQRKRGEPGKNADGYPVFNAEKDDHGRDIYDKMKCPCPLLTNGKKRCHPIGRLNIVIPAAGMMPYQIDTSSWHAMQDVRSDLAYWKSILGGLRGRPFLLVREAKTTRGGQVKSEHWPMRVRLPDKAQAAQFRADFEETVALYSGGMVPAMQVLEAGPEPEIPDDLVRGRVVEQKAATEEEKKGDVNEFFS